MLVGGHARHQPTVAKDICSALVMRLHLPQSSYSLKTVFRCFIEDVLWHAPSKKCLLQDKCNSWGGIILLKQVFLTLPVVQKHHLNVKCAGKWQCLAIRFGYIPPAFCRRKSGTFIWCNEIYSCVWLLSCLNGPENLTLTILIYFLAFLPYVSLHPSCSSRWTYGHDFWYVDARCTSPCILHAFQSVCPPHGQWPAPMGSWRVMLFPKTFSMHSF